MHCERAQEYFSDYLEHALDRPMAVALETHLQGCGHCREEVESLQETIAVLDSMPSVPPPPDGVWQVLSRLEAQAAPEPVPARRAPFAVALVQWLRTLSPVSFATGAGLATLILGGSWLASGIPHVQNTAGGEIFGPNGPAITTGAVPAPLAQTAQIEVGPITAAGRQVNLRVVPSVTLPDARIKVEGARMSWEGKDEISQEQPAEFSASLAAGPEAETLRITVESASAGQSFQHLIAVPLAPRVGQSVTLVLDRQPLEEALRRITGGLELPVVVDGISPDTAVSVRLENTTSEGCLQAVAAQVGATVKRERDAYRLVPAQ
ncbi:MAG: anti-sigma factor family protein [Armatimonadota bacterium]